MEAVIKNENKGIPIKMWLNDIETGALEQAINLSQLPFAYHHIALMPDCHQGYGMPIGGVLATPDVIVPNAVGVDIGCGVTAVKTDLTEFPIDIMKKIMGEIRRAIPVGKKHHDKPQDEKFLPGISDLPFCDVISMEYYRARHQIGTLGGGNHFIEFQKGSDGFIYFMIHSGSRNLGFKVANYYNKLAIELNEKWFSQVSKKQKLAFLPEDSDEGRRYIKEMKYCVEFARLNRLHMMNVIIDIVSSMTNAGSLVHYDMPHNYVAIEHHFEKNVWVHRKGAIRARVCEIGIIPGSQGTKSYIVEGLSNHESFESCSHGAGRRAGRKMSRKQAREQLCMESESKRLNDLGIVHSIRHMKDLDEAAGAYKDIDVVMYNQRDLVKILVKLSPLGVIKG